MLPESSSVNNNTRMLAQQVYPQPQQMLSVTVPNNAVPGQTLQIQTPTGLIQVQVPAGLKPGQVFQVAYAAPQIVTAQPVVQQIVMQAPVPQQMNRNADAFGEAQFITQQIEMMEAFGCEAKNRYSITASSADPSARSAMGPQTMYIHEESECFERLCCGPNRSLTLVVSQGHKGGPELLRFKKPFHLQGCICCCRPSLDISNSQGTHLGHVEDPCACCSLDQQVYDAQNMLKYKVYGSICQIGLCCPCCGDVRFSVKDMAGGPDGHIQKIFTCGELMGLNNKFKITYPPKTPQGDKALVLGATMLLDLQYFEVKKN